MISVNKKLGAKTKRLQILVYYNLLERLTNEEENLIFKTKSKLFSIGTIIILKNKVLLLNIGMSKTIIHEEFEPQQGT
jgi:hypothetical protein